MQMSIFLSYLELEFFKGAGSSNRIRGQVNSTWKVETWKKVPDIIHVADAIPYCACVVLLMQYACNLHTVLEVSSLRFHVVRPLRKCKEDGELTSNDSCSGKLYLFFFTYT